jgi:hypothetical protein
VIFPGPLQVQGRKLIARVPIARLGARPRADWGYSVQLSGAAWERNFKLVEVVRGGAAADALTMPVLTTGERWAFGGGDGSKTQPQVIDVILPRGVDQRQVLSSADDVAGTLAQVPFVYVQPPREVAAVEAPARAVPPLAGPGPAAPRTEGAVVSDVSDELVSITAAPAGLPAMAIGQVLGADGAVVARVVVMQTVKGGVVATVLDHRERIVRGASVRFPGHEAPAAGIGAP